MLHQELEAASLRVAFLRTLVHWSNDRQYLFDALWMHTSERVTESEYARMTEQVRAAPLPLDEAVELVAEHRAVEWESEEEWQRVERAIATELRRAVKAKTLVARGRGRSLTIRYGSLCEWLGMPVHVPGAIAQHVQVIPDDQAKRAERDRYSLQGAQELLQRGVRIEPASLRAGATAEGGRMEEVAVALAQRVRADYALLCGELLALEAAYAEIVEQFAGERVALSLQEEALDAARSRTDALRDEIDPLVGPLSEPALSDAYAEQLREAMDREVER